MSNGSFKGVWKWFSIRGMEIDRTLTNLVSTKNIKGRMKRDLHLQLREKAGVKNTLPEIFGANCTMTIRTIISAILIRTILSACNRHLMRWVENEKFVWKKIKIENNGSDKRISHFPCEYENVVPLNILLAKDYCIYQYDSIRLYIRKDDTLLNDLTLKGFIQGQYFFSDFQSNKCNLMHWENPAKVDQNGWTGYHIYLSNLREITYEKIPRKIGRKGPLTKAFRLSFYYSGQPFVNPSVFIIEIANSKYKLKQQNLGVDKLIDGGKTISFYQSGHEI